MLCGAKKGAAQLQKHLRLLSKTNAESSVYANADTIGHIVRLYKQCKKRLKRNYDDRILNFIYSKFQEIFHTAKIISNKAKNFDGKLERIAFEICRHTHMAIDVNFWLNTCVEIFDLNLKTTEQLADCIQLKKCQLFCFACENTLLGFNMQEIICNIFGIRNNLADIEALTSLCRGKIKNDNLDLDVYSEGNFDISVGDCDFTYRQNKFIRTEGVTFSFYENGRQLSEKFKYAKFADKVSLHCKNLSTVEVKQKTFVKDGNVVSNFEILNNSGKVRNIDLHIFADLIFCKNNDFVSFTENDIFVVGSAGKWFCLASDLPCDFFSESRNGINFINCKVALKLKAKCSTVVNLAFGAFDKANGLKKFKTQRNNLDFFAENFIFYQEAAVTKIDEKVDAIVGGISLEQRMLCNKKSFLSDNSLTPVCGYNLDSLLSSDGTSFTVADELLTTPLFGGDRVYAKIDGKIFLLNTGKPHLEDDVATYENRYGDFCFKLEVSHFCEKTFKVSCKNLSGKVRTLTVVLCLDFFKGQKVTCDGYNVRFGNVTLNCSQEFTVTTSATDFDKFNPNFDFTTNLNRQDICAVMSQMRVKDNCVLKFTLKKRVEQHGDFPTACIANAFFWHTDKNTLSATTLHSGLKQIGLFSLPSMAYCNGKYLYDVLIELMDNGFIQTVVTCRGNEKTVDVSPWSFALGAVWFASLYGYKVDCKNLIKKVDEILLMTANMPLEVVAKAVCLKKIFSYSDDKAGCLTEVYKLAEKISVLGGGYAAVAKLCGVLPFDGCGFDDLLSEINKTFGKKIDSGFLEVALLENFAGIIAQDGKIKIGNKPFGEFNDEVICKFFGKRFVFKFCNNGEKIMKINGKEFSSAIRTENLGDVNYIDVFY